MADLDDFFAKKDKKKSKTKKSMTTDEFVKNLEDTSKRAAENLKAKKEQPATIVEGSEDVEQPPPVVVEQEEWKEFVEEVKDYSGLKIGQLNINENNDRNTDGEEVSEGDSDDEGTGESRTRASGPWKKVIPAEEVTQIPVEIEKPSSNKVYISPALRNAQLSSAATPRRLKMRNRTAPDITNADYFPTLGAARPEEQKKKKNEPAFEEVRHGGRVQRVAESQNSSSGSSIANRFKTLDEDDS